MRNLRIRMRPWVMAGLTVAAGLTLATSQTGAAAAAPTNRWTATEITDAVLFNDGPAARALTGLHRPATRWTADMRDTRVRIDQAVAADPNWADSFARHMRSGDPRQVSQGLGDLGAVVHGVLEAKYGTAGAAMAPTGQFLSNANEQLARPIDLSRSNGTFIGTAYIGDIGLALSYGGAFTPTNPGMPGLQREMVIADIASGLRAGQ